MGTTMSAIFQPESSNGPANSADPMINAIPRTIPDQLIQLLKIEESVIAMPMSTVQSPVNR